MLMVIQIMITVLACAVLVYGIPKTVKDYRNDMRLMREAVREGRENIFDEEG